MGKTMKAMTILMVLTLCLALLPAAAQADIEGTWQEYGIAGLTVAVLGKWGNYMIWRSFTPDLETGTYEIQGAYLVLTKFEDTTTTWRYTLTGDRLYIYNEPTGISFNLTKTTLTPPARLIGEWEGEDDYGLFSYSFYENGQFDLFEYDTLGYDDGIFIANDEGIALCYSDGWGTKFTYEMTSGSAGLQMDMHYASDGEFYNTFTKLEDIAPEPTRAGTIPPPAPEPVPVATPEPAPVVTEAVPGRLTDATPEPAPVVTDAVPGRLTDATPEPEPVTTPEPAPVETVLPIPAETGMPAITSVLIGSWRGKDGIGNKTMAFHADGAFDVTYEEAEYGGQARKGSLTSTKDTVTFTYEDGTTETFRYIMMGDRLLLSGLDLAKPITYTRVPDGT